MLKPLKENVVLETIKEEKKKSAIILPEGSEKERSETGKVVAVGPEVKGIKKGDVVFYRKYSEHKLKDGEKEFIVVKAEDILAISN
jgi:chaperonin GroES